MSRDELVERFSLERVTPSPAQFDYAKLDWMNGMYLRALPVDEFAHALVLWLGEQGYDWDAELVRQAAPLVQEKIARLAEFPAFARLLLRGRRAGSGGARRRRARCSRPRATALAELEPFAAESIEAALRAVARAARPEAAAGVPADPRRRDRLEDLAGPVREHRAARPRADARAAQRAPRLRVRQRLRRRRAGRARAGTARQARRRNCVDGVGSFLVLVSCPPAHELCSCRARAFFISYRGNGGAAGRGTASR